MKRCGLCGRSFIDQQALQQHIRDSPAHTSFRCEPCNRVFKSQEDLEKHLRDSPAHAKPFRCEPCNRVFKSQEDLEKHLRDSPAHTGPFYCTLCRRTFKSKDGLDQHAKFSTIHNVPPPATPLDLFFGSFQGFQYDAKSSPSQVYAQLVMHHGWQKHDENEKSAWERYQSALQEELVLWFGAENDLSSWHSLCRAIDIEPLPSTCAQGAKVSPRSTHHVRRYPVDEVS
ncbi:hypothetical protein N7535_000177 [Penicillium sp. DV-2018c]|nr:hypothetical protein N7461_006575 [Penicillium sp. DV-2018c]KAJ5581557.1 hypothetical protein N7535_000177 [Penicillium sp. DV-2018c]